MSFLQKLAPLAAMIALATTPADAETYPTHPPRLVIPYSPGGVVDFAGRMVAQMLSERFGQPVTPDNRPGAGGIAGTEFAARSAPDGYTLLFMDPAIVINPSLQASVPYDLFRQLTAISIVSSSPEVLVVSNDLPIKSVADLIAYAKQNPQKVNYGSAGVGTTPHLAGEMLKQRTGIQAAHVPYRSIGESFPDLVSNKIQFVFSSIAGALPFTSSNQVRAIATTGRTRSAVFPDLPTVAEAGLDGFEVDLWLGLFAPRGTPGMVLERLSEVISASVVDDRLKSAFAHVGVEPRGTPLADSDAIVRAEFAKWKNTIESANLREH